jgi:hypothetical protein
LIAVHVANFKKLKNQLKKALLCDLILEYEGNKSRKEYHAGR